MKAKEAVYPILIHLLDAVLMTLTTYINAQQLLSTCKSCREVPKSIQLYRRWERCTEYFYKAVLVQTI